MAKSEARRQQKLIKKRRKDKQRKQHLGEVVHFSMLGPKQELRRTRQFPIHECLINSAWQEKGLATILLSRRQPDDRLMFGVFLVDILCLGLKNTFCNVDFSEARYLREVAGRCFEDQESLPCESELGHQIIYGAMDYARQFGFEPNSDFRLSQHPLDTRESGGLSSIEFGKEGKPFFVSGPDDDVQRILRQLDRTVGKGQYDYLCPVRPDMI